MTYIHPQKMIVVFVDLSILQYVATELIRSCAMVWSTSMAAQEINYPILKDLQLRRGLPNNAPSSRLEPSVMARCILHDSENRCSV